MQLVSNFLQNNSTDFLNKSLEKRLKELKFEKKDKCFLYYKDLKYGNITIAVSNIFYVDPLYSISLVIKDTEKKHESEEDKLIKKTFSTSDSNIQSLVESTINYLKRYMGD